MSADTKSLPPLRIEAIHKERVWGGRRLGDGCRTIGESWGAFEGNRIAGGPLDGMVLADACRTCGAELLGQQVVDRHGLRFPILTKLLDTSDWLSVQLHPDDEQAQRLQGPDQVGKTEAWHLLETAPDAEIILGLNPQVDLERFAAAVRSGSMLDVIARQPASAGDTWFIPAGTIHALGPGIFLYEVQQASDITYRVYDWERPASDGRELHIEQVIECINLQSGECRNTVVAVEGAPQRLASCPHFTLERLVLSPGGEVAIDTNHASFHALTAVEGMGRIQAGDTDLEISRWETVLVPASTGRYAVQSTPGLTLMIASGTQD